MQTQRTRKQSVTEADLDDIIGSDAARACDTRDAVRPDIEVFFCVDAGGRLTCRTRRSVDTHNVLHIGGYQTEGIVISEIVLSGKGDVFDIGELFDLSAVQHAAVGQTLMV